MKRKLKVELEAELAEAIRQRDALLEHVCARGELPPGEWGPVGRYVALLTPNGVVHMAAADTLTCIDE